MKFGIDLDGCIVNFNAAFAQKFRDRGYDVPDYSDGRSHPPTWHYPQHFGVPQEVVDEVWKEIGNSSTFWARLERYPECDARFFHGINEMMDNGHEVYFLTLRSGRNVHAQCVRWLEIHGVTNPQVLITPRGKGRLVYELALDVVIDDYPTIIRDYAAHHSASPTNYPRIYMVRRDYNREPMPANVTEVGSVVEALRMEGQRFEEAA